MYLETARDLWCFVGHPVFSMCVDNQPEKQGKNFNSGFL